jgi:hypothetical protein
VTPSSAALREARAARVPARARPPSKSCCDACAVKVIVYGDAKMRAIGLSVKPSPPAALSPGWLPPPSAGAKRCVMAWNWFCSCRW